MSWRERRREQREFWDRRHRLKDQFWNDDSLSRLDRARIAVELDLWEPATALCLLYLAEQQEVFDDKLKDTWKNAS